MIGCQSATNRSKISSAILANPRDFSFACKDEMLQARISSIRRGMSKRFRIAFSFAGEKRDFVAKVATILATRFDEPAILYDKYHEAEFARRDLGIYLPELYHKESDLVVVVICADYEKKEWCGLEWTAIHALLKNRRDGEVMFANFDHAIIKGIYDTAGFIDLDKKTPELAATLILERLALNEGHPKDHYTKPVTPTGATPKTSIPNNLPRIQPFFGRTDELKKIAEALDPNTRTWGALIDGPGGMGKTSLAVRAAYDCPPGQFHRIIFLSVKDREMDDEGERKLTGFILPGFLEMLNELARELGQPDITKSPEDQRIHLLLDALRSTQVLLILDNLESLTKDDRDQLFNFVKRLPQGCKAILTSRRRIGSGSELLILEKLDQDAALATLADLAKHNPLLAKTNVAERIALYTQTGGKPLLLRWVAGQIGRGSCRTFIDALHFLSSCPPENDPLEFIFGDLAKEFTDGETKVLCALTYFALPAKIEHIAKVAGCDESLVETCLRTLANRSLVVPDQEEQNYALVPMVAEFMRRKKSEVVTSTGKWLEMRAYALIVENGFRRHDRFPIIDAAWPNVAPALPLFLAGLNDRLQIVCDALTLFLEFSGRWDELISLCKQSEAKAKAVGDYENAAWRANSVARVHEFREEGDAVLACADRIESYTEKLTNTNTRVGWIATHLRGIGYDLKKEYASAIIFHRKLLEFVRSLSIEGEDLAIAICAVANAEWKTDDFEGAARDYREALRVARAVGFKVGIASYTGKLADVALENEDWSNAECLLLESLPLAEDLGIQPLIADDCCRLAIAMLRQGKEKNKCLQYAKRAVDIFTEIKSINLKVAKAILIECER
jgi:tetratricopeptide (TPR) repeat protein